VTNGRAAGVVLTTGEHIAADAVLANSDIAALTTGLLGPAVRSAVPETKPDQRSLSALTWSLIARAEGFPLIRHSVFFSRDYAAEFDDLFKRRRPPAEPTVYICAQDRDDSDQSPTGPERLLCLINAPATGDQHPISPAEIERCTQATFALLARCGVTLRTEATQLTTPTDFNRLFPATGGALYGPAVHGSMASFKRPGACSRLPGLYLAGGSTHPGAGVPMAALSGRMAATSLMADLSSTRRSRAAATSGGMSTR
jgi:1-hydroxycarotenoid 3,4-desaturase